MKNRQQEIAALAYELYQNRGCLDGYELIDWLEAERLITAKHLTIEAMTASISVPADDSKPPAKTTKPKKTAAKEPSAAPKKPAAKKAAPKAAVPKRKKT